MSTLSTILIIVLAMVVGAFLHMCFKDYDQKCQVKAKLLWEMTQGYDKIIIEKVNPYSKEKTTTLINKGDL